MGSVPAPIRAASPGRLTSLTAEGRDRPWPSASSSQWGGGHTRSRQATLVSRPECAPGPIEALLVLALPRARASVVPRADHAESTSCSRPCAPLSPRLSLIMRVLGRRIRLFHHAILKASASGRRGVRLRAAIRAAVSYGAMKSCSPRAPAGSPTGSAGTPANRRHRVLQVTARPPRAESRSLRSSSVGTWSPSRVTRSPVRLRTQSGADEPSRSVELGRSRGRWPPFSARRSPRPGLHIMPMFRLWTA